MEHILFFVAIAGIYQLFQKPPEPVPIRIKDTERRR